MKQRFFLSLAAALLLVSAVAGAASAQGGGGGGGRRGGFGGGMMGRGGGGGGGLQMLRITEVQKELKMTPEQITKLDAKQDEVRQSMMQAFQGGGNPQDMTPDERQKLMAKMQGIQDKAVSEVLDATQLKRYHELELQQLGPNAITRKDVADALKLTDDQKKKIADIQSKSMDDRRAAMQGVDFQGMSQDDRQKLMTKFQDIQKSTGDKIVAVLTEDQKKQWKTMQGAPFTFPAQTGGFGGRGAGGGFGGGRGRNGGAGRPGAAPPTR